MKFLSYDSPFMVAVRKLVDYALVGFLWIVSCIPIFTYGVATTAALQTAEIAIRKDEGPIWVTFWKRFRMEFKEATLLMLLWLPIQCFVVTNIWLVSKIQLSSGMQVLIYLSSGVLFCWSQLWFGYLSKFDDPIRVILGNTFRMILCNIGRTLLLLFISVIHITVAVMLLFLMPPLLMLVPGSYLLSYAAVIRKIFAKYLPEENKKGAPEESLIEGQTDS